MIYLPTQHENLESYLSSLGLVGESLLATTISDGIQSGMSNTKNTVSEFSSEESKTDSLTMRRSSEILETLSEMDMQNNTEDMSMCSPRDSHVNLSLRQGVERVLATQETCGQKRSKHSVSYDQPLAILKTCRGFCQPVSLTATYAEVPLIKNGERVRATFAPLVGKRWLVPTKTLSGTLEPFSQTYPKWGMTQSGVLYQRNKLELDINESASGFWLTPTAQDHKSDGPKTMKAWEEAVKQGKLPASTYQRLRNQVKMFPTPTTQEIEHPDLELTESGRRLTKDGKDSHSLNLADTTRLFPTPTVHGNYNRKGASKTSGDGLATAVRNWPTPKSSEPRMSAKTGGRDVTKSTHLTTQVALAEGLIDLKTGRLWSTPQARDYRTGQRKRFENKRQKNLNDQIGGQLNPDWVELLMGWPIGWTALDPLENAWILIAWEDGWESDVPRLARGVKNRVGRIKAIGNGQVPLCAAVAWILLTREG